MAKRAAKSKKAVDESVSAANEPSAVNVESLKRAEADGVPLSDFLEAGESMGGGHGIVSETPLKTELEALRGELAEWKDKALRAAAEAENTQRRLQKEQELLLRFAVSPLAHEIFAVADNLSRAMGSVPDEWRDKTELQNFLQGLQMTEHMLSEALEKFNIRKIGAVGDQFNAELHQAVSVVDNKKATPNSIVEVLQCGYLMHERVLRAAMVVIAKA